MSTVSAEATTAGATTAEAPSTPFRGLVRTVLRLHRSALWFWVLFLAVAAGALLWAYGPGSDAAWQEYRTAGCAQGGLSPGCNTRVPAYQWFFTVTDTASELLYSVPLLTAAWAGSALIGREIENGTTAVVWTQSVSPARWLAAKLAVPAALLVAGTAVLSLLHRTVWSADRELWDSMGLEWHEGSIYTANGTLLTAYTLLGLAVGVLAGLIVRSALPALAGAAIGFAVLLNVIDSLRTHLWPVETLTREDGYPDYIGMVVGDGALTSTGARVSDPICVDDAACLARHDVVGFYRDYHPSSHFWPLQLMETGIVLAVAAVAVAAAFALLRRRTA
ncbi:ABC transporter permease [Streptomyces poonensis]|uniref:ABC transporter permease n=1 Tax=Streptomyces poonensis TaxID=68255 RepID=A0A918PBH4_9ACTN|nr:ABC transporter permease [Streptomyces poonensis]GGY96283.1 hypothetical protein GCM10010365_14040 [Streptomyces poonensis]GLJ88935.1 hypothetical protein GCM10017589_15350 [Streptomyces poonensis]